MMLPPLLSAEGDGLRERVRRARHLRKVGGGGAASEVSMQHWTLRSGWGIGEEEREEEVA